LTMELSPHSLTATLNFRYSEFDWCNELASCSHHPVLYPRKEHIAPVLKLFRREPAITKLDKLFTAYLSSSKDFASSTGSDLRLDFSRLHPGQGKLAWLRVLSMLLIALLTLAFATFAFLWNLNLQHT